MLMQTVWTFLVYFWLFGGSSYLPPGRPSLRTGLTVLQISPNLGFIVDEHLVLLPTLSSVSVSLFSYSWTSLRHSVSPWFQSQSSPLLLFTSVQSAGHFLTV